MTKNIKQHIEAFDVLEHTADFEIKRLLLETLKAIEAKATEYAEENAQTNKYLIDTINGGTAHELCYDADSFEDEYYKALELMEAEASI